MKTRVVLAAALLILCSGCYSMRPSAGGSEIKAANGTARNAADIAVPAGYEVQLVAEGLTFPTGAAFDADGALHVVESGYSYGEVWTTPKLLRIEPGGKIMTVATGGRNGPWTGVAFHDGAFFIAEGGVMEGGRILRVERNGTTRAIVDGLPSFGDHHTDGPAISPDGWVYFGQGTASNSGVVGEDNLKFGWLKRQPLFHDVPGQNIRLAGQNFETPDFLNPSAGGRAKTGAFVAFGTDTENGETIRGTVKCSGGILRVRPDGSDLQLVAWGFRNPFGLAFGPGGLLFATDNGYDERGSRPVWGAADLLWEVRPGMWHGWPDFSGNEPLTMAKFKAPGKPQPKFLLAEHPNQPPKPVAKFGVHAGAAGMDIARNAAFGYSGQAFVALVGDEAPVSGKSLHPVGYKVVRVDIASGTVEDFAVNKGRKNGPASKLGTGGLERPVGVRFDPAGNALYVVDFGVMLHDKSGSKPQTGTGAIWRITKRP